MLKDHTIPDVVDYLTILLVGCMPVATVVLLRSCFPEYATEKVTKLETCQQTVDELANAVSILAVTHKAGLVGTTCMVDMNTNELELGQRFKACKLAWDKQGEEDGLEQSD